MASLATATELEPYRLKDMEVIQSNVEKGAYSSLLHLDYLGLKCAGVKIHESSIKEGEGEIVSRYKEECDILAKVRHPNISQFTGIFFQEGEMAPVLVTELLPTRLALCIEKYGVLPVETSYSILRDVALGLCYLHHGQTPPIVHRNLSSNTIVLTPSLTAKIADVGVARLLRDQPLSDVTFVAPEVASVGGGGTVTFDPSADVFSYGAVMIHMFCGKWPKPKIDHTSPKKKPRKAIPVSEAKRREEYLQAIGNDHPMMELIHRCLENDPQVRPNSKEIVERLSTMTSQFPRRSSGPLDTIKNLLGETEKIRVLKKEVEEREKKIQKREEQHSLEVKQLERYLEGLRAPLIEKCSQANVTWTQCKRPPPAIAPVQSTVINGKVYLGGGPSEHAYCYNPTEDTWTNLPPLPVKDFALTQLNGALVAVGGTNCADQQPSNVIFTLSSGKAQKWERRVPPMLTARSSVAAIGLKSALLVAGGVTEKGESVNIVEVFKFDSMQWFTTDSINLPLPRRSLSLAILDDTLYAMGGYMCTSGQASKSNQVLSASIGDILNFAEYDEINSDVIDSHWKVLQPTPTFQPGAAVLDGHLLAVCGHSGAETDTASKKIFAFSPMINSWSYISDLPSDVECTTCTAVSLKEVLVVGRDGDKNTTVFKGSVTAEMNLRV